MNINWVNRTDEEIICFCEIILETGLTDLDVSSALWVLNTLLDLVNSTKGNIPQRSSYAAMFADLLSPDAAPPVKLSEQLHMLDREKWFRERVKNQRVQKIVARRFSKKDKTIIEQSGLLFDKFSTSKVSDFIKNNELTLKKRYHPGQSVRGFVYCLYDPLSTHFKLGRTTNPIMRFRGLSRGSSVQLEVVFCIEVENEVDTEVFLHKKFSRKRVSGEWFKLNATDLAFIRDLPITLAKRDNDL